MTDAMNRFALENVKYEHSQKNTLRVQKLKNPKTTNLVMSVLNIFQIIFRLLKHACKDCSSRKVPN